MLGNANANSNANVNTNTTSSTTDNPTLGLSNPTLDNPTLGFSAMAMSPGPQCSSFQCPICEREFSTGSDVEMHVNVEHRDILSPQKSVSTLLFWFVNMFVELLIYRQIGQDEAKGAL